MIYAYKALVQTGFPNEILYHAESTLRYKFFTGRGDGFRIARIFLFYKVDPVDPIIIVERNEEHIPLLHPGLNRLIGVSLRSNPPVIDAIIYSTSRPWDRPGVQIEQKIAKIKGHTKNFVPKNEYNTLHETPWRSEAVDLWLENFGHTKITLQDGLTQLRLLHKNDYTNEKNIDINLHGGFIETLKKLFRKEIII